MGIWISGFRRYPTGYVVTGYLLQLGLGRISGLLNIQRISGYPKQIKIVEYPVSGTLRISYPNPVPTTGYRT